MKKPWVLSYPLSAEQRLWSDWADLSSLGAHSFGWFCHVVAQMLKIFMLIKWETSQENLFMPYTNNKGTDQPVYCCSPISVFVIRCQDNIIPIVAIFKMSTLFVAKEDGMSLTWSQTPSGQDFSWCGSHFCIVLACRVVHIVVVCD